MRTGKKRSRPAASASALRTNAHSNPTCVKNEEEEFFFSPASSSNQMKRSGEKGAGKHATPATAMSSPADTASLISPTGPCVREIPPTPPSATDADSATAGPRRHRDDPTDAQSLQQTFVELEKKWQRSNDDAATATAGARRSDRRVRRNGTTKSAVSRAVVGKKVGVTQSVPQQSLRTETPSTAPSTAVPGVIDVQLRQHDGTEDGSVGMQSPRPERERRKKLSVFERLSQQATASSRRKRRVAGTDHHGATPRSTQSLYSPRRPRNRAAAPGKSFDSACSLSTLSCADSVYDRLYRNESRPRRKYAQRKPRSSASCTWTISEGDFEEGADPFSAAQARVERRLTYTPNMGRTKRQQRSSATKTGNEKEQSANDEVYTRLYRDGIRAQDSRAKTEVERLAHNGVGDDVDTFCNSRSKPTSPSKSSLQRGKRKSSTLTDVRTRTGVKKKASCSPIEVLEIVNDGIDWDISCIEEATRTSQNVSNEHDAVSVDDHNDDDDHGDFDNEIDGDCFHDAKQLIDDSVDLIDNFLNSIAEMMEEAEVSAISEQAENTTFVALEEEVSRLTKDQSMLESSILIQKVCRGYISRRHYEALKCQSASVVPALVESALHSKKPSNSREDLITKYYLRERCMLDGGATTIPLQRLWKGEKKGTARVSEAAIVIQSKWRAHRAIKGFDDSIRSIVMLQAWSRGMMALRLRIQQMEAVLTIQRSWRQAVEAEAAGRRASIIRIQTQWRAHRAQGDYIANRTSVIIMQSLARQLIKRKKFLHVVQAVVIIQRFARGHSARVLYRTVIYGLTSMQRLYRARKAKRFLEDTRRALAAATIIQGWYRYQLSLVYERRVDVAAGTIQRSYRGLQCRRTFSSTVRSVVMVQTFGRRVLASRAIERQIQAATSIQNQFRGHLARQRYSNAVSAIIRLQVLARSFLVLRNLSQSSTAAIVIQKAWRIKATKKVVQLQSEACVLIQTAWRSYCHRRNFLLCRSLAITLQSLVRRQAAIDELKMRKIKVMVIAKLQAIQRGIQARREFSKRCDAVVNVQRMWRGDVCRKEHQLCIRAAIIIQCFVRVLFAKHKAKQHRDAAIVINSNAHMWLVLGHLACCQNNAIVIQRVWRGEQSRRLALHCIRAVVTIQAHLRRYRDQKDHRQTLTSIITLQASVRGQLFRALFNRKFHGASTIQRAWRHYRQVSHNHFVDVVIQLQSAIRAHACLRRYCTIRKASIAIQALARGSFARAELRRVLSSVLYIQSIFRRHLVQACISRQCAVATLIQSSYRSHRHQSKFAAAACSTIALQACFRGSRARNQYQKIRSADRERRLKAQVEAEVEADIKAIMSADQSVAEAFVAFGPCVRELTLQLYASQARAAAWASPRAKELQSTSRKGADVTSVDQASLEGWTKERVQRDQSERYHLLSADRANDAVRSIQAGIRRHRAQSIYHLARQAAISIQSTWRGYAERKYSGLIDRASAIVQSTWRGHLLRQQYLSKKSASVLVQSIWRGYQCRHHYNTLNGAATLMQHTWRSYQTQKISMMAYTQSCAKLQSAWRAYTARREFAIRRSSATLIQALFRGRISRSQLSRRCDKMLLSTICIQRVWRGYCTRAVVEKRRRKVKRRAAMLRRKAEKEAKMVIIQSRWRRYVARKAFVSLIRSAIILQAWSRKLSTLNLLKRQVRCAELLQTLWRCHVAMKEVEAIRTANVQHYSSRLIQSRWRAYIAFCKYRAKISSALLLQSIIRQHFVTKRRMRELQQSSIDSEQDCLPMSETNPRENAAAHRIQVHYLAWKTRMALAKVECAATTIQRAVRARLLYSPPSPQELTERQRMKTAAVMIQRQVRRRFGMKRIQGARADQGGIAVATWDKTFSWLFARL